MTDQAPEQVFVYERSARRLELLIRIGYWIVIGIVSWVYGILAFVCLFIQWFFILIMGRRQQGLSDFARGYFEYIVSRMPYMYFMTDQRPAVFPDSVGIFVSSAEKT
jgi:Zn-dependent protease with chaperone function